VLGPSVIDHPLLSRLGYGIAVTVGILGVVELERGGRIATPWPLRQLGAASYALYLIHGEAISFAIQVMIKVTHRSLPAWVAMAVPVAAGIVAGILYHKLVEAPLARRLNRPALSGT
jgi:exopolysaccharide production protein ExoZ